MRPRLLHELLTLAPSQHQRSHGHGNQEWEPATLEQLGCVRGEEHQVHEEQGPVQQIDQHGPVTPMQGHVPRMVVITMSNEREAVAPASLLG